MLSGGQQQMLTIARCLIGKPRLILLGEPSEGLAPRVVENRREQAKSLKETGISILMAEQNRGFVLYLSDCFHVMGKGEITYSGTPADLLANEEILDQYLTL